MINYIYWDIDPEILDLFGFSLRYYGLFFVGGLLLSIYVLKWIFMQEKIPPENLEKLSIYGMIGIFAGARLGHCLFYDPGYYLSNPVEMLLPVQQNFDGSYSFTGYAGLASHGGTLGAIIAMIFYARKTSQPVLKTIDLISVAAPLSGFFIRIANLMNSEILGSPTQVPWAFVFTSYDKVPRHPAQLYEAIAYLFVFGLMVFLYKTRRKKLQHGFFFGLAIALVFIARFFIEFVKENQVSFEDQMVLNMGQILSIPMVLIGIAFIVRGLIKTKAEIKAVSELAEV